MLSFEYVCKILSEAYRLAMESDDHMACIIWTPDGKLEPRVNKLSKEEFGRTVFTVVLREYLEVRFQPLKDEENVHGADVVLFDAFSNHLSGQILADERHHIKDVVLWNVEHFVADPILPGN